MPSSKVFNSDLKLVFTLCVFPVLLIQADVSGPRSFHNTLGHVIFRDFEENSSFLEYLVLQSSFGQKKWTLPRGHSHIRELVQQIGLVPSDLHLISGFERDVNYTTKGKDVHMKFYLAEYVNPDKDIRILGHYNYKDFQWLPFSEMKKVIKEQDLLDTIKEAREFLEKMALADNSSVIPDVNVKM